MRLFNRRVALALVFAATTLMAACGPKGAAAGAGDTTLGDPKAKVTVIEYASLSCPHCARWNADVFPQVKAKYIDTKQINYVFRPFQLGDADIYTSAGDLLGRCAGPDKYFTVIDALFHSQMEALQSGSPRDVLLRVGAMAGLSEDKVRACLADDKAVAAQTERFKKGAADKIQGTPTFFVNGKRYDKGEMPMADFDAAIAEARKGK